MSSRPVSLLSLLALGAGLLADPAHAEAPFSFAQTQGKLPKNVRPLSYVAHLRPDLGRASFQGEETVQIQVLAQVETLVLNAAQLQVHSARLRLADGRWLPLRVQQDAPEQKQELLRLHLPRKLKPGTYALKLSFAGKLDQEGRGLFVLSYRENGQQKKMLASNLEPADARRILPMWDEPVFRASYTLSVDLPAHWQAFSNMPVQSQKLVGKDVRRTRFAASPPMSSYLLALVGGDLTRIHTRRADGVELGVVSTPGKIDSAQYALHSGGRALDYFNHYFAQPYPLPKLDHIAIPGGFSGAMENWGAIIYQEPVLLYDARHAAGDAMEDVFATIAHETAHQWFGNLVTMAWWDNLWLNEGFASWMGAKAVAHYYPEWQTRLSDVSGREQVMQKDARASTHPLQTRIDDEEQAASAFDDITYGKGQAMLSMLEAWLGEDVFRAGLRQYMRKHKLRNTTSADLWDALQEAAQAHGKQIQNLRAVADAWVMQPGLPMLKIEQGCQDGVREIRLQQRAWRNDGKAAAPMLWPVPLQFVQGEGAAQQMLLQEASGVWRGGNCDHPFVFDPFGNGYYRLQYDPASFAVLSASVSRLPAAARIRLAGDTWNLVQAQQQGLADYLQLLTHLRQEERGAVWQVIVPALLQIRASVQDHAQRQAWQSWVQDLLWPRLQALGLEDKPGDSMEQQRLRSLLRTVLAQHEAPQVLAHARQRWQEWLRNPNAVPVSELDEVTQITGTYADLPTWQKLLSLAQQAQQAGNGEQVRRYTQALAAAKDPQLAARSLELALDPKLPVRQVSQLLRMVAKAGHRRMAWDFACEHRQALLARQDAVGVLRFLPGVMSDAASEEEAKELEDFVARHYSAQAQREAAGTALEIRERAARRQLLLPQIQQYLQTRLAKPEKAE